MKTVIKAHGLHTSFPLQACCAKVCVFYAMQTTCVDIVNFFQHTSDDYAQTFLCYASLAGFDFSMRSFWRVPFLLETTRRSFLRETRRLVRLLIKFAPAQSISTIPQVLLTLCISSWSELVSQTHFSDANRKAHDFVQHSIVVSFAIEVWQNKEQSMNKPTLLSLSSLFI